jgi:2'-5' RNA ligase
MQVLELGDKPGHPFRGNQYDGGLPADEDPHRLGRQFTVLHSTSPGNAAKILSEGFNSMKAMRVGGVLGRGAYGSLPSPSGEATQRAMGYHRGEQQLELEVTTHAPVFVDGRHLDPTRPPGRVIAEKYLDVSDDEWRRELRRHGTGAATLRALALGRGRDAIVYRSSSRDEALLGDQVVVFNDSQVQVRRAVANPTASVTAAAPSRRVTLVGLEPFLESLGGGKEELAATAGEVNRVPTGAMVAWYPNLADRRATALPRPDAETPEEMHVTLAYLGKAADLDEATRAKILRNVELIARAFGPFTVSRSGTGVFDTGDDGTCVVALVDSAVLEKLQETIVNELTEDDVNLPSKHGFTAHMTLVYLPDGEEPSADMLRLRGPRELTCGSVAVCFGGEVMTFPLGGAQELGTQTFGDRPGHPFRGNQWTGAGGALDVDAFIAAHPQREGEDFFAWQGRIVHELTPQQQSDVLFKTRETPPVVQYLRDGIDRWVADHGLPPLPDDVNQIPVDIAEADAVAKYFEDAPDASGDPRVRAAYEDFKRQSAEMYDYLTRPESEGGLGVTVDFTSEVDPYPTAAAQARDLAENHHVLMQSGLGGAHEATMTQQEYDRFRAVHDVFGHAGVGTGFDRHGEYEAWLTHAAMYTGAGRDAMSTEYHGVNSAAWTGEAGSPGTGKSLLLPEKWSNPPWERGVTAAAGARVDDVDELIERLKLPRDGSFARRFDKLPWHPTRGGVTEEFGDKPGHPFRGNQYGTGGSAEVIEAQAATLRDVGVKAPLATRLATTLVDLNDEYGTNVSFRPVPTGSEGFASTDRYGRISVNPNLLTVGNVKREARGGWLSTNTPEGMITHEWAHAVIENQVDAARGNEVRRAVNRAMAEAGLPYPGQDRAGYENAARQLSEYALEDGPHAGSELIPEAWAAWKTGARLPKWARAGALAMHAALTSSRTVESSVVQLLEFGDKPGHPFRGNQYGTHLRTFHTTTRAAAESIERNGWDPFYGSNTSFGAGIYSSLDTPSGRRGQEDVKRIDAMQSHVQSDGDDLVQLELEVTTRKPFTMTEEAYNAEYDRLEAELGGVEDYEAGLSLAGITPQRYYDTVADFADKGEENLMQFEETHPDADTRPGEPGRALYREWHDTHTPDAPLQDYYGSYEEQAVRALMLERGYDSIIFRDPRIGSATLGDQIVSLRGEDVRVVRSTSVTAAAVADANLITIGQWLELLKATRRS